MSTKQALRGIPSYRRRKASEHAVVTLNGVDFYLGPWNSPESKAEYDRVTAEGLARGRRPPTNIDPGELLERKPEAGAAGGIAGAFGLAAAGAF